MSDTAGIGHNSDLDVEASSAQMIRSYVERIERLEEEKKTIAEDMKDVYAEAKGKGFDTKIIRKVIQRRKLDREELAEIEHLIEVYERALSEMFD